MRITMKTLYATPDKSVAPGQTADFDDDEATKLIEGGYAVRAGEDEADGHAPEPQRQARTPRNRAVKGTPNR